MSGAQRMEFGAAVTELIRQIEQKVKPRSIEIGFDPDPLTGEDPAPGDPVTWYVEVIISDWLKVRRQARGIGQVPVIEALAAAAESLGITVRVRYEEASA